MINENISYARSILSKTGIDRDSDEYQDYLKIREICGTNNGYVGILTKIRFIDGVEDMDEIESIFDILKDSDIDINKLNKMSYEQILDLFYDDIESKSSKDYELVYKDPTYSYYRVYTYEGILKIGSPAWCLKTKSHWDRYYKELPIVWVVIENKYKGKLLTPNTYYLGGDYINNKRPWVRYGVSLADDGSFVGFNDNNKKLEYTTESFTTHGILSTIRNLTNGIKKSYYDEFKGCEKVIYSNEWLKVKDPNKWIKGRSFDRIKNKATIDISENSEVYVKFSRKYDFSPLLMVLNPNNFFVISLDDSGFTEPVEIGLNKNVFNLFNNLIKKKVSPIYSGLKLRLGLIDIDTIENLNYFVKKIDKWLVYNFTDYYLVVNTLEGEDGFDIETRTLKRVNNDMDNPLYWYIDKNNMKPTGYVTIKDYHKLVINSLKSNKEDKEPKEEKKVKGFWDFLRRK